ncbi:MAG: M48 family metallopeptidase [Desulfobacterales bacterium]
MDLNFIAVLILTFLCLDMLVNVIGDMLNLNELDTSLPDEFIGYYDLERYRTSRRYIKANTRFDWIWSAFSFMVILGLWFGKGFYLLDEWVRGLNLSGVLPGIIYLGVLVGLQGLLYLPFRCWRTFYIEEKFGFNTTTAGLFVKDTVKALILFIFLGLPFTAAVLLFFQYAGPAAWVWCWALAAAIMVLVQFAGPAWIMPLFNTFDPIAEGELKTGILNYAEKINFPLKNVYVMDGSKRSSKSNAFFAGYGKNKRIVLFDTLVNRHSVPEITAVLAHEMGHYKLRHIPLMMIIGFFQIGAMFFLLSICISFEGLFEAFFVEQQSVYAGLVFFGILFSPAGFVVGLLFNALSRKNEYSADAFAVKTTGKPEDLVTALKKLFVDNLGNPAPHPFYVFLHYSHPPVLNRIRSIRKISKFS